MRLLLGIGLDRLQFAGGGTADPLYPYAVVMSLDGDGAIRGYVEDAQAGVSETASMEWQRRSPNGSLWQTVTVPAVSLAVYFLAPADYNFIYRLRITDGGAVTFSQPFDPLVGAIAPTLPGLPQHRYPDYAASLRFASSTAPRTALNVLASGSWVVSARPGDGCLYQGTTRTTEAIAPGDPVGSVWSLQQTTTAFLRQTDNALRGAIADNALRVDIGRHLIALNADGLPGFTGWSAGERLYCMKADADPSINGIGRFDVSQVTGTIFRISVAPGGDSLVYDRWGASQANIPNAAGIVYDPVSPLNAKFLLRSRFSAASRFSAVNLEAESFLNDATTSFTNNYSLGDGFARGSFSPFNYYFMWARNSQLTTGDRTTLMRFISHYCGLGLY